MPTSLQIRPGAMFSFCPEGFVGIGVSIGTDAFIQNFVSKTCRPIIDDAEKLDDIQDDFMHYQLLRFWQSIRLQYTKGTTSTLVPTTRVSRRLTTGRLVRLADLFHTTHKVKTKQVSKSRGQ